MNISDLSKAATDLPATYSEILSHIEIPTDGFKKHATLTLCNIKSALCLDLLKLIHKFCSVESYPNLGIALKKFLAILVMVASCNRSLSKLQLFLKITEECHLVKRNCQTFNLSIENELSKEAGFENIIHEFASIKAREINL